MSHQIDSPLGSLVPQGHWCARGLVYVCLSVVMICISQLAFLFSVGVEGQMRLSTRM